MRVVVFGLFLLVLGACEDAAVRVSRPSASISPELLFFGTVGIGNSVVKTVELRNDGSGPLSVRTAFFEPRTDSLTVEAFLDEDCRGTPRDEPKLSLESRGCARFSVRFAPTSQVFVDTRLVLTTDDPERPRLTIQILAEGIGPRAEVCVLSSSGELVPEACSSPGEPLPVVDFGRATRGEKVLRTLRIRNEGATSLSLSQVKVGGDETPFTLEQTPGSGPLEPGEYEDLRLSFEPSGAVSYEGVLLATTNEAERQTLRIPLVGRGTRPRIRVCLQPADEQGSPECAGASTPLIGYPATPLASLRTRILRIHNDGDGPLNIDSASIALGAPEFGLGVPRTRVEPESHVDLEVVFVPRVEGTRTGRLELFTDDWDQSSFSFELTGRGAAPSMKICALDDLGTESEQGCSQLGAVPRLVPSVDFGQTPWFERRSRKVRIRNEGIASLVVNALDIEGATSELSLVEQELPLVIEAQSSAEIELQLAPMTSRGALLADLKIVSNEPRAPELYVPVRGTHAGAELCLVPGAGLDFGRVNLQSERTLGVIVRNCGLVPFVITELDFSEQDPSTREFAMTGTPPTPFYMQPSEFFELTFTYRPAAERVDLASLRVKTSYDSRTFPVRAEGAPPSCASAPPVARAGADRTVKPRETVTLDGRTSSSPRAGTLGYLWRLRSAPLNSTASVLSPTSAEPQLFTDLAGDYLLELVVTDSGGCQSAPDTVLVKAVPDKRIHVQLTWPQGYGDLDLHYIRPGGIYYSTSDVYWGNRTPSWGARLDVDDTWGFGPENVNHDTPSDGVYQVWVHYYCGRECSMPYPPWPVYLCGSSFGSCAPTLKIFVDGVERLSRSVTMSEGNIWQAATITVSGGGTSIVPAAGAGTQARDTENGCAVN